MTANNTNESDLTHNVAIAVNGDTSKLGARYWQSVKQNARTVLEATGRNHINAR